jgi:signal transduction histidine kinase
MFNTLYRRLVLSHLLPLLLVAPIMGVAFVYVLETQIILPNVAYEAAGQAVLVAEIATDRPEVWVDVNQARALIERVAPRLTAQVMLLDRRGRMLASSRPADDPLTGQVLDLPDLPAALAGQLTVRTAYGEQNVPNAADVLVPLVAIDGRVVGIVRIIYDQAGVFDQFLRVRFLVFGVLAVGLIVSGLIGWRLAVTLATPLRQVTDAVYRLAGGERLDPVAEQGPRETRLLARAVNGLVEHLRSLEDARRQLLANLVHELGRPLGALRAAARALAEGADDDPALRKELLAGIEGELRRLNRLLDDLAGLHDQVLGTMELGRRPVPLSDWLPTALAPWQAAAAAKNLSWQATVPADLPTLSVDPDRLGQALGNLLSNAVKYTPPGGVVTVTADADPEQVSITVADTGPGISADDQSRIFDPFYRGHQGNRFPQGLGLGLTIAYDLVSAHGGRLDMESVPGQPAPWSAGEPALAAGRPACTGPQSRGGSRFTIRLPVQSPAPDEPIP